MSEFENEQSKLAEFENRLSTLRMNVSSLEGQYDALKKSHEKQKAELAKDFPDLNMTDLNQDNIQRMITECEGQMAEAEKVVLECQEILVDEGQSDGDLNL